MSKNVYFFTFCEFGKKNSKKEKHRNAGEPLGSRFPMFLHFLFVDFSPHNSVKRKKLDIFWNVLLFLANVSLRCKN